MVGLDFFIDVVYLIGGLAVLSSFIRLPALRVVCKTDDMACFFFGLGDLLVFPISAPILKLSVIGSESSGRSYTCD